MLRWVGLVVVGVGTAAQAVVVRGHVRTPLGVPVAGARVQLVAAGRSVGDTVAGVDGSYEIRAGGSGRFTLLTSAVIAGRPAVQVGAQFYGGRVDVVTMEVALEARGLEPEVSGLETGHMVPLAQMAGEVAQVREFGGQATAVPVLRTLPGGFLVESGPVGATAALYLRGAGPETLNVGVDGVTAEDLGGGFDFNHLGTESVAEVEAAAGASPVDAGEGGAVRVETGRGTTLGPALTYTGSFGSLGLLRNAVEGTATRGRVDALGSFARFDVQNELTSSAVVKPFHLATVAGNVGYGISGGTSLRVVARREVAVSALTLPEAFFGFQPAGRRAEQHLYGSATFETSTAGAWRNTVRYGLARKRGQTQDFAFASVGLPVTITGANGFSAAGVANLPALPAREDRVTDRDEATWQTDYGWKPWLQVLGQARYQDERGADLVPGSRAQLVRTHGTWTGSFSGQVKRRVFYEAAGEVDRSPTYGWRGAPRVGLTWAAVEPGRRPMRGTVLHAAAATGFREGSVVEAGFAPRNSPRSRTFELAADQNVLGSRLTVRGTYFHGQYSHEFETLGVDALRLGGGLAYRAQGAVLEGRYQPSARALVRGGYTYLASEVEQSGAVAVVNPNLPGRAIGALTALAGQRPFRRAPQTGFVAAEYGGAGFTAAFAASFAGRSDDSTFLVHQPSLLLPNRDLSPGWAAIDARLSYSFTPRVAAFVQVNNLADQRHIAPLGYFSTPLMVVGGIKVRLGPE